MGIKILNRNGWEAIKYLCGGAHSAVLRDYTYLCSQPGRLKRSRI